MLHLGMNTANFGRAGLSLTTPFHSELLALLDGLKLAEALQHQGIL